jgi:hypothetical protein
VIHVIAKTVHHPVDHRAFAGAMLEKRRSSRRVGIMKRMKIPAVFHKWSNNGLVYMADVGRRREDRGVTTVLDAAAKPSRHPQRCGGRIITNAPRRSS